MANANNSKIIFNDKEQKDNRKTTKVVIITSVEGDDDEKILSCLNPSNVKTSVVDLNNTNLIDGCQLNTKQTLSQLVGFDLKIIT